MSVTGFESMNFRKFTYKQELDKALQTLQGILKGISIDNYINFTELTELRSWCDRYRHFINRHPFSEFIPLIDSALEDNYLDEDEIKNIIWVCDNFISESYYYDAITLDILRLQGILHGILSDNIITKPEIIGLSEWLDQNNHLVKTYPYDEINSLVTQVLANGVIDNEERDLLKVFFSQFIDVKSLKSVYMKEIERLKRSIDINGICAVNPQILIQNKVFCFTGISSRTKRHVIADTLESLGGIFKNSVSNLVDYLIIGNNNNPCWCFSCYGRKVEKAMNMRKNGHNILIVHENDFWDALEDIK